MKTKQENLGLMGLSPTEALFEEGKGVQEKTMGHERKDASPVQK